MDTQFIKRIYQSLIERKTNLTAISLVKQDAERDIRLITDGTRAVQSQIDEIDQGSRGLQTGFRCQITWRSRCRL